MNIGVIGGGAAGFFAAIACAQTNPHHRVIILEKTRQLLTKVKISGGGRCNVTHACFDPAQLVQNYPRGSKALRGPFSQFQPKDTIHWFESRGIPLKTESDGRMFPTTDNSQSIIDCLLNEARKLKIDIKIETNVTGISKKDNGFLVETSNQENFVFDRLLIATGSQSKVYTWLESFGHTIVPLVPSLFTFNIPNSPLVELSGISMPQVHLKIENTGLEQTGPLLITHWGFSGPAVLKLSAFGARILHSLEYKATLIINWIPRLSHDMIQDKLLERKKDTPNRQITSEGIFDIPKSLWKKLCEIAEIPLEHKFANLSKKEMQKLISTLTSSRFEINGKSTYKEEFVTAGGVALDEVNFKTMESKKCPGLHFAGEVLDIDGITGGFNFQNAWTTAWIAGTNMAELL